MLLLLLCTLGLGYSFHSPLLSARHIPAITRRTKHVILTSSSEPSQKDTNTKTLLQVVDEAGLSLKPKAMLASEKASLAGTTSKKILLLLKTSLYYTLFIVYRGYRGLFVILPAVFKQVYQKMEIAVDSPFEDSVSDSNQDTGTVRWRTRITVSVLAMFVTASYVAQGAIRVLMKFIKSLTKTSDVSGSFVAAVMEQEANEKNLERLTKTKINGSPTEDYTP